MTSFGLTVTISGGGESAWTFSRSDGVAVEWDGSIAQALATSLAQASLDAMAPESYQAPTSPDPISFGIAILHDATIALPLKLQLVPWTKLLADQLGDPNVIATGWSDLVTALSISDANQVTIVGYATQFAIPGITVLS